MRRALLLLAFFALTGVLSAAAHDHGASSHSVPVTLGALPTDAHRGLSLVLALLVPLVAVVLHRGRRFLPLLLGLFLLGHFPQAHAASDQAHGGPAACCTLAKSTEPPPPLLPSLRTLVLTLDWPGPDQPGCGSEPLGILIRGPPA